MTGGSCSKLRYARTAWWRQCVLYYCYVIMVEMRDIMSRYVTSRHVAWRHAMCLGTLHRWIRYEAWTEQTLLSWACCLGSDYTTYQVCRHLSVIDKYIYSRGNQSTRANTNSQQPTRTKSETHSHHTKMSDDTLTPNTKQNYKKKHRR